MTKIQYKFDLAVPFRDGFANLIDKTGTYVIKTQFDFAGAFSEGLAPVAIGNSK